MNKYQFSAIFFSLTLLKPNFDTRFEGLFMMLAAICFVIGLLTGE
jgi:hypothetical protein